STHRLLECDVEPETTGRMRLHEHCNRRLAPSAVVTEPRPRLEAAQSGIGVQPEVAVESPRGEAVPRQVELQRRDVEAARTALEHSDAERRVSAERGKGARAGDAVARETRLPLQSEHGVSRARARDAVDRPEVKAAAEEGDLQRGDARVAHRGRGGRVTREEEGQSDERSG